MNKTKEEHDKELKSFVIATLRRASYRWYSRTEALKNARVSRGLYKCESCGAVEKKANVQLDHISPIVPTTGWDTWDGFINRLFCEISGYQVLCSVCHTVKTRVEGELRKKNRQETKKKLDKTP